MNVWITENAEIGCPITDLPHRNFVFQHHRQHFFMVFAGTPNVILLNPFVFSDLIFDIYGWFIRLLPPVRIFLHPNFRLSSLAEKNHFHVKDHISSINLFLVMIGLIGDRY